MHRYSPGKFPASAESYASPAADAPAVAAAHVSPLDSPPTRPARPEKQLPAAHGSLPVRPASTPTVRSARPHSPPPVRSSSPASRTCARTASAATWRSTASAAQSLRLARRVAHLCEGAVRPWKEFVPVVRRLMPSMLRGSAYRDQEGPRAVSSCAQYAMTKIF